MQEFTCRIQQKEKLIWKFRDCLIRVFPSGSWENPCILIGCVPSGNIVFPVIRVVCVSPELWKVLVQEPWTHLPWGRTHKIMDSHSTHRCLPTEARNETGREGNDADSLFWGCVLEESEELLELLMPGLALWRELGETIIWFFTCIVVYKLYIDYEPKAKLPDSSTLRL